MIGVIGGVCGFSIVLECLGAAKFKVCVVGLGSMPCRICET